MRTESLFEEYLMKTEHKSQPKPKTDNQPRTAPQLPSAAEVLRIARAEALGSLAPKTF